MRPLVHRVWAQRRLVLATTLVAAVLGVLVSMLVPKWYRSTAVILPPEETDITANLGVMGRALSKFPALGEFGEYTTPADIYKAILRSRHGAGRSIIDRFHLMDVYRIRSRETAMKQLAKSTGVKLNPDGTIEVYVEDRDPRRAAALAGGMIEALDRYNIAKRNTQGHRTRVFLEQRVAEVDLALRASEVALKQYQEAHSTVAPVSAPSNTEVASAADLMAQKIALEVRIGVLRGYLREDDDQLVQARRQLAELERQIARIPALQSDLARLGARQQAAGAALPAVVGGTRGCARQGDARHADGDRARPARRAREAPGPAQVAVRVRLGDARGARFERRGHAPRAALGSGLSPAASPRDIEPSSTPTIQKNRNWKWSPSNVPSNIELSTAVATVNSSVCASAACAGTRAARNPPAEQQHEHRTPAAARHARLVGDRDEEVVRSAGAEMVGLDDALPESHAERDVREDAPPARAQQEQAHDDAAEFARAR
jgi:hypothetical protein